MSQISQKYKRSITILIIFSILGAITIVSIVIPPILMSSEKEEHTDYKLYLFFQIRDDVSPSPFLGFELRLYILGDFSINSSTQNYYFTSHREYYEIYNESRFLRWNEYEINKTYIQDPSSHYHTFINYTVSGEIYHIEDPSEYYCRIKFSLLLWANGTWNCVRELTYHFLGSEWTISVDCKLIT